MMLRVVLPIIAGVVRISVCDDLMSLPRLPPLPAEIEKLFKTAPQSSPMPESNTGQSNQSFELLDEDYTLDMLFTTGEENATQTDNRNFHSHHHHHHHTHGHSRAGNMESSLGYDDGLSRTGTGQDFVNNTNGREIEEAPHNHDEKESVVHHWTTANPFRDTDAALIEKSQRESTENLREQNSERDGEDAINGSGTELNSGRHLLAITLFFVMSLA